MSFKEQGPQSPEEVPASLWVDFGGDGLSEINVKNIWWRRAQMPPALEIDAQAVREFANQAGLHNRKIRLVRQLPEDSSRRTPQFSGNGGAGTVAQAIAVSDSKEKKPRFSLRRSDEEVTVILHFTNEEKNQEGVEKQIENDIKKALVKLGWQEFLQVDMNEVLGFIVLIVFCITTQLPVLLNAVIEKNLDDAKVFYLLFILSAILIFEAKELENYYKEVEDGVVERYSEVNIQGALRGIIKSTDLVNVIRMFEKKRNNVKQMYLKPRPFFRWKQRDVEREAYE